MLLLLVDLLFMYHFRLRSLLIFDTTVSGTGTHKQCMISLLLLDYTNGSIDSYKKSKTLKRHKHHK